MTQAILHRYSTVPARKTFFAALMFIAAYFTTITVNAQADADKTAVVSGFIICADQH